jgi:tetratricopeptide (TPR) repeat protein
MAYGPERLLPAIRVWFEALKILLWPHPLQIYYDPVKVSHWLALATHVALLAGAMVAYLHKRPLLLIGLVFFYIAFLPSSRIIGEPGMLPGLSDRILYLPSVGFTIMLAFGLKLLAQKLSLNAAAITVLIVTAVLTPLTWARNTQWANDMLLFESDYRKLDDKADIGAALLAALLRENNNDRAVEICDENRPAILAGKSMGVHCGSAYGQAGRFRDAEQAYLSARNSPGKVFAHFNLAMMYVHLGRRTEAEEHVALAIAAEKMAFLREYFKAVALIQLHPSDRNSLLAAHAHLEQALKLQPQHVESHKELDLLNQRLNEVPPAR